MMNLSLANRYILAVVASLGVLALLVFGLGSVLVPFLISALLAYLGDPLADRLEAMGAGRSLAVTIVFSFLSLVLFVVFILLAPLLGEQIGKLVNVLPAWLDRAENFVVPILQDFGLFTSGLGDHTSWREIATNYWKEGGNIALQTIKKLTSSGAAVINIATNLVLIPVVTFYLLRDWDILVAKLGNLLPKPLKPSVLSLAADCNEVLSSFFRGQFVVMITLAIFYSVALSIMGLDLAVLVGTLAGLANIIPYMGFVVGIVSALIAAWMEFHALGPILIVVGIFVAGQILEGMFLTPLLVGDKIGLHPVAVIFALMAGGKLAGFTGLLIALPVAAMLMVLIRFALNKYQLSDLYLGENAYATPADFNDAKDEIAMLTPLQDQADFHPLEESDDIDSVFYEDALWQKEVDNS